MSKEKILIPDFMSIKIKSDIENAFFDCKKDIYNFIEETGYKTLPVFDSENDRVMFSSGSTLYRGYYCPSPVVDIVVGNTKRGKLSKTLCKRGLSQKYLFNEKHELVATFRYEKGNMIDSEIIMHDEGVEHGINFSGDMICDFCECVYNENGQIALYSNCHLLPYFNDLTQITQEKYEYKDGLLINCNVFDIVASPFGKLMTVSQVDYCFEIHDGKFKQYTCNDKIYKCYVDRSADEFTRRPRINKK